MRPKGNPKANKSKYNCRRKWHHDAVSVDIFISCNEYKLWQTFEIWKLLEIDLVSTSASHPVELLPLFSFFGALADYTAEINSQQTVRRKAQTMYLT